MKLNWFQSLKAFVHIFTLNKYFRFYFTYNFKFYLFELFFLPFLVLSVKLPRNLSIIAHLNQRVEEDIWLHYQTLISLFFTFESFKPQPCMEFSMRGRKAMVLNEAIMHIAGWFIGTNDVDGKISNGASAKGKRSTDFHTGVVWVNPSDSSKKLLSNLGLRVWMRQNPENEVGC